MLRIIFLLNDEMLFNELYAFCLNLRTECYCVLLSAVKPSIHATGWFPLAVYTFPSHNRTNTTLTDEVVGSGSLAVLFASFHNLDRVDYCYVGPQNFVPQVYLCKLQPALSISEVCQVFASSGESSAIVVMVLIRNHAGCIYYADHFLLIHTTCFPWSTRLFSMICVFCTQLFVLREHKFRFCKHK